MAHCSRASSRATRKSKRTWARPTSSTGSPSFPSRPQPCWAGLAAASLIRRFRSSRAAVALAIPQHLGFVALVGAQFIGRLLEDGLVDSFGQRVVARAGGAIVFPTIPGTIIGFGVATLVPAAIQGADEIAGLRPGTGLATLSWLMRSGFLLSPPIVGLIADTAGLRAGLFVVPLAGLLVIVLSGVLSTKRAQDPHQGLLSHAKANA